jgi:hypothetical protein
MRAFKAVGLAFGLTPFLYMGAYYATLTMDARGCCFAMPAYKIGEHRLPDFFDDFFSAADRLDDHIHLAQCKSPKFYKVSFPIPSER